MRQTAPLSHESRIRRLPVPVQFVDVRDGHIVLRRQPAVHHEHLFLDDGAEGELAEGHGEEPRGVHVELVLHLPLEAVDLVHVLRLVVASRQVQARRVHQLVPEKRQNHLEGEGPPVDEVPVEEVGPLLRGLAVRREDVQQIVKLSVHVAAYGEGLVVVSGALEVEAVGQLREQVDHLVQHHRHVLAVDHLLIFESLDHFAYEFDCHHGVFLVGQLGSVVAGLHHHAARVHRKRRRLL
mmetsp:Transcript_620/g.1351  ORF Transcript_620/g.1351 Transcript_620/m.1351 type:complete len:238 (-) Transcript_620:656-1369(-)